MVTKSSAKIHSSSCPSPFSIEALLADLGASVHAEKNWENVETGKRE